MTKQEAAKILLERRKARKDFWAFCQYMDPGFFTNRKKHLKVIAHALQKVSNGSIKKLIISLPPRAGKSYIVTMFCVWMLGLNPEGSIMRNSYGASLALKFSRHAKIIVQSVKYNVIFPDIKLSKDHTAVEGWSLETSQREAYFCGGVGGPLSGNGCDTLAVLDDPHKDWAEGNSEVILSNADEWKQSVHDARIEGDCPQIIISTRWNRQDIPGLALEREPGKWKVISVSAMDENDNSFCEEIKTTAQYREMKAITDKLIWESVFQQNPIAAEGLLYDERELNYFTLAEVEKYESGRNTWDGVIGYTDTADEGTDFLASPIGKIYGANVFITDVVFSQEPVEITEGMVAAQLIRFNPDMHVIESNNGGKAFARNVRELIKGQSTAKIKWKATTSNKMTRMIMKSGKVRQDFWFRSDYERGSDYDKFMKCLTTISRNGKNKNDDAGDAVTGLAEMIDKKAIGWA